MGSTQSTNPEPTIESSKPSFFDNYLNETLKSHDIVIFSKTTCPYCDRAKEALSKLNLNYHSIELDVSKNCPKEDCSNLASSLMLMTRIRTVPQIFVNGKLIGGFTDLDALIKSNKFEVVKSKN